LFAGLPGLIFIAIILHHPEADASGIEAQESIACPGVALVFSFYAYFVQKLIDT
jgi:hypothetical protein